MSLNIGTITAITSANEGKLQPQEGGNEIIYSDEEFGTKGISEGGTVCYELVFVGSTPIATNLILVEANKTTVWDGGVHDAINVGAPGDTGAFLLVKGGAMVNGNSSVTKSTMIVEGGSTINGNITATQRSVIGIQGGSTINGTIDSHQGINLIVVDGSRVIGSVEFKAAPDSDNDSMSISNSDIDGDIIVDKPRRVKVTNNNNGKTIAGKIDISRAGDVVVTNNKVGGAAGIKVFNVDTCEVCNNELAVGAQLDVPAACTAGC